MCLQVIDKEQVKKLKRVALVSLLEIFGFQSNGLAVH